MAEKKVIIKSVKMSKTQVLDYMRHLERQLLDPKTPQSLLKGYKETFILCGKKLSEFNV